jgi:phytanoyl-CoA hydroxylase
MMKSAANLYTLTDPVGSSLNVPSTPRDDLEYFTVGDSAAIKSYYDKYGYVVVRGLIPKDLLDTSKAAFDDEVLPTKRFIYRQATANPERHAFTPNGFMLNSILNVHSMDPRHFLGFREASERVLSHSAMQDALDAVLGEPGKLVQSMYFHGNPATWPHQDTYYLDSAQIGSMTGAWIAAEDIAPGAGRFFVYPGSHKIDMQKNGGNFDIAFNHDRYKQLVNDLIKEKGLECRAPALASGDVLFWNSKTIHGSLATSQPEHSRRSFTGHYIPQSHQFLQFQSRIKSLELVDVNGMQFSRAKDQTKVTNRAVLFVESTFPRSFKLAKSVAVKLVTSRGRP